MSEGTQSAVRIGRVIKARERQEAPIEIRHLDERDSQFALAHDFGMTEWADTQPSSWDDLTLDEVKPSRLERHFKRAWR